MKKTATIYTLFLLIMVWSGVVSAERSVSSAFREAYGTVDAIYPQESRIIISDMNLHYTYGSGFYKDTGARLSINRNELKLRTPVKFSFYKTKKGLVLKKLIVVSKREFNKSRELSD